MIQEEKYSASLASLDDIVDALRTHDNFAISGHEKPDGDSIGSTLALASALLQLGKSVVAILPDSRNSLTPGLKSMPLFDTLVLGSDSKPADTFVCVDISSPGRLGSARALCEDATYKICIDHHRAVSQVSNIFYSDALSPSTTCIIWEVCKRLGATLQNEIATLCYAGLLTDTGGFRYQNTSSAAFSLAFEMVNAGANPSFVATAFYQSYSWASLKLQEICISHMEFLGKRGDIAISWVSEGDFRQVGATSADSENLIDVMRSLDRVNIACLLRPREGKVRGSLRAKDNTDIAAFAGRYGGGGHVSAAGFTYDAGMDEAYRRIKHDLEMLDFGR